MPSFHFDLGDSNEGPVGFCARIAAESKEDALKILQNALDRIFNEQQIESNLIDSREPRGVEYITVYFNPDKITTADIDEENEIEAPF